MADHSSAVVLDRPTGATGSDASWDYMVKSVHARHNDVLESALKESGAEGWELVFMHMPLPNEYQLVFRRSER